MNWASFPSTKKAPRSFFNSILDLYERVSIAVTSNLRFSDWNKIFGDETMTAAVIDRLTHKGHILEFTGESYRFRQRRSQEEQENKKGKTEAG